jgi:hypothetical protein
VVKSKYPVALVGLLISFGQLKQRCWNTKAMEHEGYKEKRKGHCPQKEMGPLLRKKHKKQTKKRKAREPQSDPSIATTGKTKRGKLSHYDRMSELQ